MKQLSFYILFLYQVFSLSSQIVLENSDRRILLKQNYRNVSEIKINNNGKLAAITYLDDSLQIEDNFYREKLERHLIRFSPDGTHFSLGYKGKWGAYLEYKGKTYGPAYQFYYTFFNPKSFDLAFCSMINEEVFVHYRNQKSGPFYNLRMYMFRGTDLIFGDPRLGGRSVRSYLNHQPFPLDFVTRYSRYDFSENFKHYAAAHRNNDQYEIIHNGQIIHKMKHCPDSLAISQNGAEVAFAYLGNVPGFLQIRGKKYYTGSPVVNYESTLRFSFDGSWIYIYSHEFKGRKHHTLFTHYSDEKDITVDKFSFLYETDKLRRFNLAYSFKKGRKAETRINNWFYSVYLENIDIRISQDRKHCAFWDYENRLMRIDHRKYKLKGASIPIKEEGVILPPLLSSEGKTFAFSYFAMQKDKKTGTYININGQEYGPFRHSAFSVHPDGRVHIAWIKGEYLLIKRIK